MLTKIRELLKKYNKKVWVLYNNEGTDKIFCRYISSDLNTATICFITENKIYLLANSLDAQNALLFEKNHEDVKSILYDTGKELEEAIEEIIANLNFPKDLSLSYSTMHDTNVDILTHGQYLYITKLLKVPYSKYNKKVSISSAEKIIYELASKKTDEQIKRLKILATITNEILQETFSKLQCGMTEKEIVDLTINISAKVMKDVIHHRNLGIIGYNMGWPNCPIVLTGANLAKGGHSLPSDKKLLRGDSIYFDFGIKGVFSDQEVLYTDMQRMGYALKEGEKKAPKNIQKVFDTLVNSIEDGIDEMKPDVKAWTIDTVVRQKIVKAGYPDYMHATGHPVGIKVHDIGAIISLKSSKRANLQIIENGVYTLEPRINIANGGSIEEMILATKFGGIPLCDKQTKIYLVK
ncbi:MAG: M24 family metallopeptidase [Clostridia bacterium]|nr:M24 family metallopeptidase [Clostridia bacterium]